MTALTVFVEAAEILTHEAFPGEQYVLRLRTPRCAAHAAPGTFVHLQCDPMLPMRRPFSIQRADPGQGWVELLYKVVGNGTRRLAQRRVGDRLSLLGPVGQPFRASPERPRALLLGGGVGIPPVIFLAEGLGRRKTDGYQPLVFLGSELPFPFAQRAAARPLPGVPGSATVSMALLEEWGVPGRLASTQGFAGCYRGYVTELAVHWLANQNQASLAAVEVFACGPRAMLKACARLARAYGLPCQVALEEYMACGIGGCAGCTVRVQTENGAAMKRVCVDGPVFDAHSVFGGS